MFLYFFSVKKWKIMVEVHVEVQFYPNTGKVIFWFLTWTFYDGGGFRNIWVVLFFLMTNWVKDMAFLCVNDEILSGQVWKIRFLKSFLEGKFVENFNAVFWSTERVFYIM